ncbi:MAG: polysaccharide deacetylase family protein, partial [Solirubrobacterales bacterium]|nr:polysaccharide deacetylase family protein [Solirubrobacterales bacterium]
MAGVYKLTPERFKAHLEALAAAGQWFGAANLGSRALLTFDDGGASSLWIAGELERYGWRGAFFIVTSRIGTAGFLDASGVRELAERGHLVGSHSHTHPAYMARLNGSALAQEWSLSRSALSDLLGSPPRTGAVPGGSVSSTVIEQAARAGYEALFTSTPRARINRRYGMPVLGRYTVWADDPPELAVALVKGE